MASPYEYGLIADEERGLLGALANMFSPMRRPIRTPAETTYMEADGALYPQYKSATYGEPEFGFEYMPAYRAISGLLSDPEVAVDAAAAMPEAMRQMANQQVVSALDVAGGGSGELVDEAGNQFGYDALAIPATSAIAPAAAMMRAMPNETVLGSGAGKIGHNRPPAVVGKTPAIVPNELRGTEFRTAVLPDGSRTLIDAGGNPYIEEKTLNKLLTGVPHDRMTSEFTPPPAGTLLPEVEVKPEDFEGSWMVNLSGDRTRFGNLSKVNDIELYGDGVDLEGGNDYMRSLRAVWASAPGAVSGIENQIKAIRKGLLGGDPDAPIYGITTNMAERSGDFAVDTAETIMRMIPNSPIKRDDLKAFEASIKKKYPDYPGLANPEKALEWLTKDAHTKGAGNRRLFFVQEAAKGTNQKKGFPDIGSVRAAISEPETKFMPYGRTGAGIGLLAPQGQLAARTRAGDASDIRLHKTYPDTVGDALGYEGGYGVTLNRSLGFPDDYALSLQTGQDAAGLRRTYDIGRKAQFMRPDVVDPQMEFIEAQKQMLRNQGILY